MTTNVNWLGQRKAGAILNLQRTPYSTTTDTVYTNPAKATGHLTADHTRVCFPDWPDKSVKKVTRKEGSTFTTPVFNLLELEITATGKESTLDAPENLDLLHSLLGCASARAASNEWTGGDDQNYESADFSVNFPYMEDKDGDGIAEQYYYIYEFTSTLAFTSGTLGYVSSGPVETPDATSPQDYGGAGLVGTPSFSTDAIFYAQFNGSPLLALDVVDDYMNNNVVGTTAKFMPRKSADSAHGLSAFPYLYASGGSPHPTGSCPKIQDAATFPNVANRSAISTYRHASGDKAHGSMANFTAECKWYYTPDPYVCKDCWYKDIVLTVDVTYKKAQVTYTYDYGYVSSNFGTLGSWSTHSTVTQTLTIPAGKTRQQVGSTFNIPVVDGYIVTIDDIKLVSVA